LKRYIDIRYTLNHHYQKWPPRGRARGTDAILLDLFLFM